MTATQPGELREALLAALEERFGYAVVPPRLGHLLARLFGYQTAAALFCRAGCCPASLIWDDETEEA